MLRHADGRLSIPQKCGAQLQRVLNLRMLRPVMPGVMKDLRGPSVTTPRFSIARPVPIELGPIVPKC